MPEDVYMAKNSKKNKAQQNKKQGKKSVAKQSEITSASMVQDAEMPVQAEDLSAESPEPQALQLRTQIGVIQTDLYERLFKPAFVSFAQRRDDEPLRQLVEGIVTSIAMHDAYDSYRTLDDICQRYLYYLESVAGARDRSWETIQTSGLCDYWRSQVFMVLIRESSAIFSLLLPEGQPEPPAAIDMIQSDFLDGCDFVLNDTLGSVCYDREHAISRDLYDFVYGMSFPWLGYNTESIFNIRDMVADSDMCVSHEFAMASAEQVHVFYKDYMEAVKKKLYTDLVYTQHRKVYDELSEAYEADEGLPMDLVDMLSQRIKFDKSYQSAYDKCIECSGDSIENIHRNSRLNPAYLNSFKKVGSILKAASELNHGVYLFHYIGKSGE